MQEGRTPLIVAAGDGNLEILRALLAEGADLFAEDKGGRTAYLTAAAEGHLSILQELALRNRNVIESVTKVSREEDRGGEEVWRERARGSSKGALWNKQGGH